MTLAHDVLADAFAGQVLLRQRRPLFVVTLRREDWADLAPRLELAGAGWAVLLPPIAVGTALVVATAVPGLRECLDVRYVSPAKAAALWAEALATELGGRISIGKRWSAEVGTARSH